ncbi:prominin isoform X3 [Rhynchophorus ferrugineus]|uniref:prominin isoform X3 n=1 Tax=Rhynchophorus ferrugineus TaxID=354439 RepID=UPI003FCCD6EA
MLFFVRITFSICCCLTAIVSGNFADIDRGSFSDGHRDRNDFSEIRGKCSDMEDGGRICELGDRCLIRICPDTGIESETHMEQLTAICNENFHQELSANRQTNNRIESATNKRLLTIGGCTKKSPTASRNKALPQINQRSNEMNSSRARNTTSEQDKSRAWSNDSLTYKSAEDFGLRFLDIPMGDELKIRDLHFQDEHLLFQTFSSLMGYLFPLEFPLDLLRDSIKNNQPFHLLFFQIIKLEIVLVSWIIFWAIVTLSLPIGVAIALCTPNRGRRFSNDYSNGSLDGRQRWMERSLACLLHALLLLILFPVVLVLAGNEQIAKSISRAPISTIYDDISTFIRNTHMQMSFVTTSSTDIAIEAIRKDLEDIDALLGASFQQELSTEIGIDVALVELEDLKSAAAKAASIVSELLIDCDSAVQAGNVLQEELQEISRQLKVLQQQCGPKDRPLCNTVQFFSFDLSLPMKNLTQNDRILQLGRFNTEKSLNTSIETGRKTFLAIPDQIALELTPYVTDIKTILGKRRSDVYKATHDLDILARELSEETSSGQRTVSAFMEDIIKWDLWRWLAILGIMVIVSLTWGLLICGAPCGCGLTSKTIPLLLSGVGLSCCVSFILWCLGTTALILGGHGKTLICRPLYDPPNYRILGDLLDDNGVLYPRYGLLHTLETRNSTIFMSDVLRKCQRDNTAYRTFHLKHHFNLDAILNYKNWKDLRDIFDDMTLSKINIELFSTELESNLQNLVTSTSMNLSVYRNEISSPLTTRDLSLLADQLNTIARQLTDPVTTRKFDNMAFSMRRISHNELQKLNEIRGRVLYKVTALEVLLPPLNRRANQSLSHLKTVRLFLDNRALQIGQRTRRQFLNRIENYLSDLYRHVASTTTKEIGKCRPLWEIFHAIRFFTCELIADPLNGIAVCCYFLIFLFIAITPIVLKLIDYYRQHQEENILTSISRRRSTNEVLIEDEATWATPLTNSPDNQEAHSTSWISPPIRVNEQHTIPSPPRLPNISSRVHESRSNSPRSWI